MRLKTVFLGSAFLLFVLGGFLLVKAGSDDRVSGWTWSDTVGWISFNSTDCDPDKDGFSVGIPTGCPGSNAPVSGLIAYWNFDDGAGSSVAADSAGINDGTLVNMDAATDWVAGKFATALDFDGSDDWVSVADADALSFGDGASTDSPFTIAFWINPDDTGFDAILDKRVAVPEYTIYKKSTMMFSFRLFDNDTSNAIFRDSSTPIPTGAWSHIVATYDGSATTGGMNIYLNGILDNGAVEIRGTYVAMHNTTAVLEITDTSDPFDGKLDEIRMYDRALSPAEAQDLYDAVDPAGPVVVEDYGVSVDLNNGNLSGYAWADTIGWIRFDHPGDPPGVYPEAPNYAACLDRPNTTGELCDGVGDNTLSGWVRALADGGGWDAWIKLRGTWDDGVGNTGPYGVGWDPDTQELSGWAWGDEVVGWISFNDSTVVLDTNTAPDPPSNLQDNEATLGDNYCFKVSPPVVVSWDYTDPDDNPPGTDPQSAYQVQIDDDPGFGSITIDSGKFETSIEQYAPVGLLYGTTYYWRVRVWDSPPNERVSAWAVAPSPFTTDAHAWPNPSNLSWTPFTPQINETVQFDDGNPFDPAAGAPTSSPCGFSWCWTFSPDGDPGTSTLEDPTTEFPTAGSKTATLEACDELGCCDNTESLNAAPPIPLWKEASPLSN